LAPCFSDLDLERAIVLEELLDDFDEQGHRINTDDLARETLWRAIRWASRLSGRSATSGVSRVPTWSDTSGGAMARATWFCV